MTWASIAGSFTEEETVRKATMNSRAWQEAHEYEEGTKQRQQGENRAQDFNEPPLDHDVIICNSDAALKIEEKNGGLGWVFRSKDGEILTTESLRNRHVTSTLRSSQNGKRYELENGPI